MSIICLVFPRYLGPYNIGLNPPTPYLNIPGGLILTFGIFIPCFIYLLYYKNIYNKAGFYILLSLTYILSIIISFIFHIISLRTLDPKVIITVTGMFAEWSQWMTCRLTLMHLLLPILILLLLILFKNIEKPMKAILILPVLYLPSIGTALWQQFINRDFLNTFPKHVFGLGTHPCSFGMALFFMLPLSLIGIIYSKKRATKTGYFTIAILILLSHFLRVQITVTLGWILFAITLLPVSLWANNTFKKSKKIIFSFLLILSFTCFLLPFTIKYYLAFRTSIPDRTASIFQHEPEILSSACDRILDAKIDSARILLSIPALYLIQESPLAGWGPSGFRRNAANILAEKNPVKFRDTYIPILHHNAGDHYLQVATDFGLLCLLGMLLLHIIPLWMIFKVRHTFTSKKERWLIGILVSSSFIWFILYLSGSHVFYLEVAWPVTCIQSFLVITAIRHGFTCQNKWWLQQQIAISLLILVFTFSTIRTALGEKSTKTMTKKIGRGQGYYTSEYNIEKNHFIAKVWTSQYAEIPLHAISNIIRFNIFAPPQNTDQNDPFLLKIFVNTSLLDVFTFPHSESRLLTYYAPGINNSDILLKLETNKTFNPYRLGESQDNRNLGIQLWSIVEFNNNNTLYNGLPIIQNDYPETGYLHDKTNNFPIKFFINKIPKKGIGLYTEEKWPAKELPESLQDADIKIRWTGMRASFPIPPKIQNTGGEIYLKTAHPDIEQKNVALTVMTGSQTIKTVTFSDHAWQKIVLTPGELDESGIVTLIVDRTWNPKLRGISEDSRDLGVAVLIPEMLSAE